MIFYKKIKNEKLPKENSYNEGNQQEPDSVERARRDIRNRNKT